MKPLFDQTISHRLVVSLARLYPDSSHVRMHALKTAEDDEVWDFAREHGFIIVSKDSDFFQRSLLRGVSAQSHLDSPRELPHGSDREDSQGTLFRHRRILSRRAPFLFDADLNWIQEQLGLKLVSTKGPVDVIVIDHIERPTEN